jgi:proteasome lid subunit RPN8/RPN11
MVLQCAISRSLLAVIHAHAAREAPREACGLLFGTEASIEAVTPAVNVADQPERRFEIDPAALFAALRAERGGGRRLIGYYHSHPSGDTTPSRADAGAAAPDGRLWLIVAGNRASLWRAETKGAVNGRFTAVELLADPGQALQ